MDNAEFEKILSECGKAIERISLETQEVSERLCLILQEHDDDNDEARWSCHTLEEAIADLQELINRRNDRYHAGDLPELPSVFMLAIECCERLQTTAQMCREGRGNERRDLKGQIESNLGYLIHHIKSMQEDGYLPDNQDVFGDLFSLSDRIFSRTTELETLTGFICNGLNQVHDYLEQVRRNEFWEKK